MKKKVNFVIDENKLLDELKETFTDEFLHEKKFCLARYSFMDLLKEMIDGLTKVDCGNCSRRKFYQRGYQDGLKKLEKWREKKITSICEKLRTKIIDSEKCPRFERAFRQVAFEEAIDIVITEMIK